AASTPRPTAVRRAPRAARAGSAARSPGPGTSVRTACARPQATRAGPRTQRSLGFWPGRRGVASRGGRARDLQGFVEPGRENARGLFGVEQLLGAAAPVGGDLRAARG